MCIARHSTVRKFWWREIATLFKTWINGCSNPRDIKRRAERQVEAVSAPLDQILLKAWLNLKSSGNWRESTRPWSRRGWDEWMNDYDCFLVDFVSNLQTYLKASDLMSAAHPRFWRIEFRWALKHVTSISHHDNMSWWLMLSATRNGRDYLCVQQQLISAAVVSRWQKPFSVLQALFQKHSPLRRHEGSWNDRARTRILGRERARVGKVMQMRGGLHVVCDACMEHRLWDHHEAWDSSCPFQEDHTKWMQLLKEHYGPKDRSELSTLTGCWPISD